MYPGFQLVPAGIAGFDELRDHAAKKAPLGRCVETRELGARPGEDFIKQG